MTGVCYILFGAVLEMDDDSGKSREEVPFVENRELCGIGLNPCYFSELGVGFLASK